MSKLNKVTLGLLGPFALEADMGRPIAISVRAKKARALLAYLAMKPGCRARREELATLFWGDNPDMLARHSLRQCLISLRQDLSAASEILTVDRDAVGISTGLVAVDVRRFTTLAEEGGEAQRAEAAALWRGAFLSDLVLDAEEFDGWRQREADRLSAVAAGVFEAQCRNADAAGEGERAVAAALRLIELDPAREDRQRTALPLLARYKGRDAALSQAKQLTDFLRNEINVSPEAATRAVIERIKKGEFDHVGTPDRAEPVPRPVAEPAGVPDAPAVSIVPGESELPAASSVPAGAAQAREVIAPAAAPFWRRRPLVAALASLAVMVIGAGALGFANFARLSLFLSGRQLNQSVVVLPFAADQPARADDSTLARLLTHDVIGYLSRFGNLRVISEPTSEIYRDRQVDGSLLADLGVQYAIVGHVQGSDDALRIDFQLVNTATQTNVWSDSLQHKRADPTLAADETARGIARMLAIEIDRRAARETYAKPNAKLTLAELVGRGYLAMERGTTRENLSSALQAFGEALRRNPHYLPAQLAVARVQIIAAMNFIDLEPHPDLDAAERLLNDTLSKFPNSFSALYSLALLHKHRHEYEASTRLLQRCLELNPSVLPAQAQIGDILVRTGQPQKGLDQILQTMRAATSTDPSIGYWYLYAAEAELELGHGRAALDWALRAHTFMPGSPLVQAWLASIYATAGDKLNAAKYVAALRKMAPDRMQAIMQRTSGNGTSGDNAGNDPPSIIKGLQLALSASPG